MLDAKSHACIMMGYYEESKSYRLFDPIKQEVVCWRVGVFDENTLGITLLNFSSTLLSSDPLDILENSRLTNYYIGPLTRLLTPIPKSTCNQPSTTKTTSFETHVQSSDGDILYKSSFN
jgi:hypothetical protein